MNEIKIYKELTYIETYDNEIRTTTASLETVSKLLKEEQFINLGNELINRNNIKRVFVKELSDVEKIIYSIEDKQLREIIKEKVDKRKKDGLRINVGVIENLLNKHQNND